MKCLTPCLRRTLASIWGYRVQTSHQGEVFSDFYLKYQMSGDWERMRKGSNLGKIETDLDWEFPGGLVF